MADITSRKLYFFSFSFIFFLFFSFFFFFFVLLSLRQGACVVVAAARTANCFCHFIRVGVWEGGEKRETCTVVPKRFHAFRDIPSRFETFQVGPKRSQSFRNAPSRPEPSPCVPRHSNTFQVVPRHSNTFQDIPTRSKYSKTFLHVAPRPQSFPLRRGSSIADVAFPDELWPA